MQTTKFTNNIKIHIDGGYAAKYFLIVKTWRQPNLPTSSVRHEDMQTTNLTNNIKLDLRTCRQVFPNCEDMQTTKFTNTIKLNMRTCRQPTSPTPSS